MDLCSYRRPDINNDFTPVEQQELANLTAQYLTAPVFAAHLAPGLHHTAAFFPWHRTYIAGLESFLLSPSINKPQYVPLPKWDPQNPIPAPFFVIDSSCGPCGILPSPFPTGLPALPSQLNGSNVCTSGYVDVDELRMGGGVSNPSLEYWHDGIHVSVGDAFGSTSTATHLLIFLLWHAFVDDIYWCYCQCGDCSSIPAAPTTSPMTPSPTPTPNYETDAQSCLEEAQRLARQEVPVTGLDNAALVATANKAIATFTRQDFTVRRRLQLEDKFNATLTVLDDFRSQSLVLVEQEPFAAFLVESIDQRIEVCKILVEMEDPQLSNPPAVAPTGKLMGSISGSVMEDVNQDLVGDINLSGIAITLLDSSGIIIGTTLTDSVGDYIFYDVPAPGGYNVLATGGGVFVWDVDGGDPNNIAVELGNGGALDSTGNDFVD